MLLIDLFYQSLYVLEGDKQFPRWGKFPLPPQNINPDFYVDFSVPYYRVAVWIGYYQELIIFGEESV